MYLFVAISIVTFLLTFSQNIIKIFSVGSWFSNHKNDPRILKEIGLAQEELKSLEKHTMGDYAKTIRRMRAENKIATLRSKLKSDESISKLKGASMDLICGYVFKGLLSLMLIVISFKYRYTPVVVFNEKFNFAPFSGIITFPTGVHNAISVPFCVLSCNVTFRWFGSVLKTK